MIRGIFRVQGESFLTYDGEVSGIDATDATLEELVGLCDHDAENRNAHDFCGVHRLLGAILIRNFGRQSATIAMRDIAQRGGLQGMAGICCESDSYGDLGVGEQGRDWNGTYEEDQR